MSEIEYDSDGTIKRKKKGWKRMERPKHPEAYSTREYAAFQPWKVDLKVEIDNYDPTPITYTIFCRAQNVHNAQYMAYAAFMTWEHVNPEIEDPWPRVCTGEDQPSTAEKLTEDQWEAFWKEAQHYPNVHVGMRENPSIFRFAKPGWNHRGGILDGTGRSIIVPDKKTIAPMLKAQMKNIEKELNKKKK